MTIDTWRKCFALPCLIIYYTTTTNNGYAIKQARCCALTMFRALLISLSQNATFRRFVMGFPLSRRFARRFVAGEQLSEAVAAIQRLNRQNILATFDQLGENVTNAEMANADADEYVRLLDAI